MQRLIRVRRRAWPMLSPCVAIAALAVCFTIRAPSALSEDGDRAKTDMVRISVLSLFHPKELVITPGPGSAVEMIAGNERLSFSRGDDARVILDGVHLTISTSRGMSTLRVDALSTVRAGWFLLEVPGKLRRRYFGSLAMRPHGTSLESVVTMPIETAVASIVAAESPPGAPMEALKAQAVATRSFLVARQSGHIGFDFCDTTHCQFLRSPPDENSLATRATAATRGLVLTWHDAATAQDQPVAAMYARSCGGETRSLREVGVHTRGYPYYAVHCTYCQRHPEMWQRQLGTSTAPRTERDRLLFNRVHGWGAVPSLADSTSHTDVGSVRIEGRGIGHGIGLCQLGAADMARHGTSFDRILAHYYPDTKIRSLGGQLAPPIMP